MASRVKQRCDFCGRFMSETCDCEMYKAVHEDDEYEGMTDREAYIHAVTGGLTGKFAEEIYESNIAP